MRGTADLRAQRETKTQSPRKAPRPWVWVKSVARPQRRLAKAMRAGVGVGGEHGDRAEDQRGGVPVVCEVQGVVRYEEEEGEGWDEDRVAIESRRATWVMRAQKSMPRAMVRTAGTQVWTP